MADNGFLLSFGRYCEQETVREELEGILRCDEVWLHSLRQDALKCSIKCLYSANVCTVCMFMYLCYVYMGRYSTDEWDFETPFPAWATRRIEPLGVKQPPSDLT